MGSRIEDILQSIIDNTSYDEKVEYPSRIEKILLSIKNNTAYTEEAQSRIEALLLAIKNSTSYDEEVENPSRIESILLAKINSLPYTDIAQSNIEELLIKWLFEAIQELTGIPPLLFKADGTPLLDYLISGNTVQNGTPTPDSPIQPQSCGERTGNLFSGEFSQFDDVGGTGNIYTYFYIPEDFTLTLIAKDTHTIPDNIFLGITKDGGQSTGGFTWAIPQRKNATEGDIFTVKSSTSGYHYVSMYRKTASVLSWILEHYYVMLNLGSTALPYEPYGYKIPISSANTTTPVYLGEVQTTRKIKKLVLTGNESINYSSAYTRFSISIPDFETMGVRITPFVMSHYIVIDDGRPLSDVPNNAAYSGATSDNHLIFVKTTSYTSSDDFKSYLAAQYAAGTPVTVWYVLAEPETAVVNEPLMRIGGYADTLSMEQAGVQIPTANGSTTLDVETTVKPSEVYIKYKEV